MKQINPVLTDEIKASIDDIDIKYAEPYFVSTYRKLVEQVARLAYLNKNNLLFFRGQRKNHFNKAGASRFYPTIYRDDYLLSSELKYRFKLLEKASSDLCEIFQENSILGNQEVLRKKEIQWSILQHYKVCKTPLLDFTHSIWVASSFAQEQNQNEFGYVYVFGLPYINNWLSHSPDQNLLVVRLLSVCPPDAIRPYFQEGYLAGTEDIEHDYSSKMELDFSNRLIAKFKIPSSKSFWGRGFDKIPNSVLFPKGDKVEKLFKNLKNEAEYKIISKKVDNYERELKKVVHNFGFSYYMGHKLYPKGEYDYIVKNKEGEQFILEAKYWNMSRGINFPSEQILKYQEKASKYKSPFILITNVDLTQKAQKLVKEFNKRMQKKNLIVIKATSYEEILKELKKII